MSKLRNNMVYQTIYQILAVCVPLVTSPYLSRVLGAEGLGIYSFNYSIVSYFMLFALLGVKTYGMRAIAQSRGKEQVSRNFFSIYYFQILSALLSIIAYLIFIPVFIKDETGKIVSYIHIIYLVAETINISWLFFGMEKYKTTVIRDIIVKILTVIGIFVFVREKSDVITYIFILAFGMFLSNVILWLKFKECVVRIKVTWQDIKMHIKPNLLLFIPALEASLYHMMDKTILGIFSDNLNSGYYYNADKLLNIPLAIVIGCSGVFLTRISTLVGKEKFEEAKKVQRESICLGMWLISAIAFGVNAVANEFVPWFFGQGFEPCIELIKYFAVIVVVKTISSHTRNSYLIPEKCDKIYINSITCGAIINLVAICTFVIVFKLGALGATLGTMIAEFSVMVAQLIFMKKSPSWKRCLKDLFDSLIYLVLGVLMYLVIAIIPLHISSVFIKIVVKVLIGVTVYMIECIILWKYKPTYMPDMISETMDQIKNKLHSAKNNN